MCSHPDANNCPAAHLDWADWDCLSEGERDLLARHAGTCPDCHGCEGCDSGHPGACECAWLRRPHAVFQADWSAVWAVGARLEGLDPDNCFRPAAMDWLVPTGMS